VAVDSSANPPTVLRRDSAGIEIVATLDPGIDTLSTTLIERLRIGVQDGPEHLQFFGIRGIEIADNEIYVTNYGTSSIRVFTLDGVFVRELGGKGSGPGEFDFIEPAAVWHDTVYAGDQRSMRGTMFDKQGQVLSTWRTFMADGSRVRVIGGSDAGWLVDHTVFLSRQGEALGQTYRDPIVIGLVQSATLPILAEMPRTRLDSAIHLITTLRQTRQIAMMAGEGVVTNPPFFEPSPHYTVNSSAVFATAGWPYEIDVYDLNGRLFRRVSRSHQPVVITDGHVEEVIRRADAYYTSPGRQGDDLRSVTRTRAAMPRVGFLPVAGRLLANANGTLWVERIDVLDDPILAEWTRDAPPRPSYWDVFGPDGVFRHMARFPAGFTPRAVLDSLIVGVARDELNVEYVVGYEVRRETVREDQ
jgi:hypothetical protein